MNPSSRFVVATHILTGLHLITEHSGLKSVTSDTIAESVNTNPVVIRRLLGQLRKAGLVRSQSGARGGFSIALPVEKISLLDVYRATEDGSLFHFHYTEPNQICPVGCTIQESMKSVCSEAEEAVANVLENRTIADLAAEMMENPLFGERARAAIEAGIAPGS